MLLRQTLAYLPAQIAGPVAQVAAALAWTHWLAPAPYGLLTFLIASQELVFLASMSWWTHYTMRYLGGLDSAARERFARSEAPVLVAGALLQGVGTVLVFELVGERVTPELLLAAIAYVVTRSLLNHLGERARTQGRIGVYTLGQVAGSVVGFAVALAAVVSFAATPAAILWSYALAQAIGLVASWRRLGLSARGATLDGAVLAAALRYGAPLLFAGAFAWIAQNGIRIVVEHGAGATALGLLAVGWGLGQRMAATLAMLVVTASFPLAVRSLHDGSREAAYSQIAQAGLILTGLTMPAAVGLCFLAEPLATLFVAAPFRASTVAVLPFAAAAGVIRNIRMHVADPVFLLIERPRVNLVINAVDATIMVAGCTIGLVMGGLVGAVAGALAATCLSTAGGFALAARIAGFGFPLASSIRIAAATLVMAIALAAAGRVALAPPVRLIADIALGVAVYGAALAALLPSLVRGLRRGPRVAAP